MALNFPADTSKPYVDPVSGLKYIYNTSIGGWETAIQPPVIIGDTPPAMEIPGFLWWDSVGGNLYVKYEDSDSKQWIEASPSGDTYPGAITSEYEPSPANIGDIWLDIINPNRPVLKIYGVLGNVAQWIPITYPSIPFVVPNISSGLKPVTAKLNDIWFDRDNRTVNVYTENGWVESSPQQETVEPISIRGVGAVSVAEFEEYVISVRQASYNQTGVIKLATQNEVNLT